MTAAITAKRIFPLAFAALVVVGIFTASASGRTEAVKFVSGNSRVVQGNEATVTFTVQPAGARCSLAVRYKGGAKQGGLPVVDAKGMRATWNWQVPRKVQTGPARVTARCAGAGRATRRVIVIGQIIPPKHHSRQDRLVGAAVPVRWHRRQLRRHPREPVHEARCARRQRDRQLRHVRQPADRISGVHIWRHRRRHAACASAVSSTSRAAHRSTRSRSSSRSERAVRRPTPSRASRPNAILPSVFEPEWCGSVEGEVQNDSASRTLQSFTLSTVVFDAAGNIIGGGMGFGGASLPPSARVFFKISTRHAADRVQQGGVGARLCRPDLRQDRLTLQTRVADR